MEPWGTFFLWLVSLPKMMKNPKKVFFFCEETEGLRGSFFGLFPPGKFFFVCIYYFVDKFLVLGTSGMFYSLGMFYGSSLENSWKFWGFHGFPKLSVIIITFYLFLPFWAF